MNIRTTFTNPEGLMVTYANEFLEASLLQLNSSNNYYTSGEHDIIFIKIGSSSILILDCTYFINRDNFQNEIIDGNIISNYDLEFSFKGTSNEYGLQSVYNANGFVGVFTELQVFLM